MYYASKQIADRLWTHTANASANTSRATRFMVMGLVGWLLISLLLNVADEDNSTLSLYLSLLLPHVLLLHSFFFTASYPG